MKAVSGKALGRALKRHGWVLKRIKGSHHIYEHADHIGTTISVPMHGNRSLRTGTQHSIMKAAGLTEADL